MCVSHTEQCRVGAVVLQLVYQSLAAVRWSAGHGGAHVCVRWWGRWGAALRSPCCSKNHAVRFLQLNVLTWGTRKAKEGRPWLFFYISSASEKANTEEQMQNREPFTVKHLFLGVKKTIRVLPSPYSWRSSCNATFGSVLFPLCNGIYSFRVTMFNDNNIQDR